ncbi:polymer-forming cytoskeletal protein [Paenibacillus planticolens]|uniref:Polymer-forming cytoskeletal protein n=1 Tax=Paenibacillus planticolens TaxID=2654976 RepID=A0ABX1ZQ61_9BACL|nr:polymer-forming cytoskeletal protein [Paenibacillus planticolens]NOV02076.1 hypothetical protein [Paenibacillus planticolens]
MRSDGSRNLIINGIGSSNGGIVRNAKIDGVGKVDGDIACTDFILNGRVEVLGSVKAASAEMNGSAVIAGDLHAARTRIQGRVRIEGDFVGESMEMNGTLIVKGSCEAETFNADGKLQLGALNADTIHITVHGNSSVAEIGGETIRIRKQPGIDFAKWLRVLPLPFGNKLTAQVIEGDHIDLAYTTAEVVRGANVKIGPGCEIGLVEYTLKFDQDKSSAVKQYKKV